MLPRPECFTVKGSLYRYKPWSVSQRDALEEAFFTATGHFDLMEASNELSMLTKAHGDKRRVKELALGIRAFTKEFVKACFQHRHWHRWHVLNVEGMDAEAFNELAVIATFFLYVAPETRRRVMLGRMRRGLYDPRVNRLRAAQYLGVTPAAVSELDATIMDDLAMLSVEDTKVMEKAMKVS